MYGKVRNIRENNFLEIDLISDVIEKLTQDFKEDWLLRIEILELLVKNKLLPDKQILLKEQLEKIKLLHPEYPVLIERGMMLAGT